MNDVLRGSSAHGPARWVRSWVLFGLVSAVAGLLAGMIAAKLPLLLVLLGALLGTALLVVLVRWPEVGPALFWLVYSLQSTVFAGISVTGMYYPLYALMALNAFIALGLGRLVIGRRLLPYLLFLVAVLLSLLPVTGSLDFTDRQRLFIYVIGFLVFFQFPTDRIPRMLTRVQVVTSLSIVVWVVITAAHSGFGYRAAVSVNQNDVSFLLGFGILALLAQLAGGRLSIPAAVLVWALAGGGVYAMLLLASRGMSIGLTVAALTILGRSLLPARRSVPVLLAAVVAGVVLVNLPGSDQLFLRFHSANVATANQRIPLWKATIQAIEHSNVYQLLAGHGFGSSMGLIRRVSTLLTSTHNAYVQMAYDFGLFGLVSFLAIHFSMLRRFWSSRSTTTLYAGSVVTFMLMSDLTGTMPNRFLYWIAVGYLLAIATFLDRGGDPDAVPARGSAALADAAVPPPPAPPPASARPGEPS